MIIVIIIIIIIIIMIIIMIKNYSLDTSPQRRNEMLKELNEAYCEQIASKSIRQTYLDMIKNFSYRLLALFTYSKTPKLVRKHLQSLDCPLETDVSILK